MQHLINMSELVLYHVVPGADSEFWRLQGIDGHRWYYFVIPYGITITVVLLCYTNI